MSIAFIVDSDQLGVEDYDGLMRAIGRESLDTPTPAGSLAHLSGPKPAGGWQVIDVWDSQASADAFYGSAEFAAVAANAESLGLTISPWPLHRAQIPGLVNQVE